MTDEELQERMERGDHSEDQEARVYRHVFAALRKEPSFKLSPNFADHVYRRIVQAESPRREMVWLVLGLFSFVIALVIAIVVTGFTPSFGVFEFVSSYPGLFVFAALFVGTLHWIDKRLVQKPMAPTR